MNNINSQSMEFCSRAPSLMIPKVKPPRQREVTIPKKKPIARPTNAETYDRNPDRQKFLDMHKITPTSESSVHPSQGQSSQ